ncbi:hypothetical protein diail_6266 [Diaporthe ilicicola]|nr:hypothetical protein diail_6266 [Diaporthe ilicicola]
MEENHNLTGKSVAVIGAGVSGLVAAKRLAAEGFQVDVFERRSRAGGLWNFSPDPTAPFASAVYADLQTNFPRQLMELQDYPWINQPLFMHHNLVQEYLEGYAEELQQQWYDQVQIDFNTEVVRLFHEPCVGRETATCHYGYVVVASGVFDEPSIPHYQGLSIWREQYKDSISHAKTYRNPDAFRGKNVLIVGYQASGFDIANKIAASVSKLWVSSTQPLGGNLPSNAKCMGVICCFYPAQRMVKFLDMQTISEVDHIIFCTGYQYHQPFLKTNSDAEEPLFPSGPNIEGLHEHCIYIEKPTLAFLGMVRAAVPTFLLVQAQAAFVSRFFSGHLPSPCKRKEHPEHRLPYPKFMDYLLRLESVCEQSDKVRTWSRSRYHNPVFRWTWELDLIRTKRREIRGAFLARPKPANGIWNTADTIHEYHYRFLSLAGNVGSIMFFLILYYGYRGDHESNLQLPFQVCSAGFFDELTIGLAQDIKNLSAQLERDSQGVFRRGFKRLSTLLTDRLLQFN